MDNGTKVTVPKTRCAAKTITGKCCKNVAQKDHQYCWFHCRSRTTNARFYQNSVVQAVAGIVATVLVGKLFFQLGPTKEKQDEGLRLQYAGVVQQAAVLTSQELMARGIQEVQEKLNLLDTNRVRVEVLTRELEQLQAQGVAYTQTMKKLEVAVTTINELRAKLETAQYQLSSSDRQRITNAVTQAQTALGTVNIGHLTVQQLIFR